MFWLFCGFLNEMSFWEWEHHGFCWPVAALVVQKDAWIVFRARQGWFPLWVFGQKVKNAKQGVNGWVKLLVFWLQYVLDDASSFQMMKNVWKYSARLSLWKFFWTGFLIGTSKVSLCFSVWMKFLVCYVLAATVLWVCEGLLSWLLCSGRARVLKHKARPSLNEVFWWVS